MTELQLAVGGRRDPRAGGFVLRVAEAARVILPESIRKICRDTVSYFSIEAAPPGTQLDHVSSVRSVRRLRGASWATSDGHKTGHPNPTNRRPGL